MNQARRALILIAILLSGAASAQPGERREGGGPGGGREGRGPRQSYADPSGVIAAEMAFNRLAVEKGQWTAFARTSAKDAVMFTPRPVLAQKWLKGQRNPAATVRWQPHEVTMSCDGAVGISTGAWQRPDGSQGWFVTIWRRDRKTGAYQWIFDDGDALATPLEAPEAITGRVAECRRAPARGGAGAGSDAPPLPLVPGQPLPDHWDERSDDGSLRWRWAIAADGSRTIDAWMAKDGGEEKVIARRALPERALADHAASAP